MRPTTKDLALAAGVSLATVDRVLNGRPGVRLPTVQAVNDAIERIGFVRNLSAANLARGRTYRFEYLLPRHGDQFLETVVAHIDEVRDVFASEFVEVRYRRAVSEDPHQVAQLLSSIDGATLDGVALMAPESPQVRDSTQRLRERGVQVVQFVSGNPGEGDFVGVDNRAAGATAGHLLGRFVGRRSGQVLVVAENLNSRDSLERRQGFDRVMAQDFGNLAVLPTLEMHGDAERTQAIVRRAYASHDAIIAAYVMSSEARLPVEAISQVSDLHAQTIVAHERTRFSETLLADGRLDAVIAQNPGHLVRSALRILRARCDNRERISSQEEIRIEILLRENLGSRPSLRHST